MPKYNIMVVNLEALKVLVPVAMGAGMEAKGETEDTPLHMAAG